MIESLIVLIILCFCMLLCIPNIHTRGNLFQLEPWIKSEMVCMLKDGYLYNQRYDVEITNDSLHFIHNRIGKFEGVEFSITPMLTITKPLTIVAYNFHREIVLKVWLGMGRVYVER